MCHPDPFLNDQNYLLSVLTLEELGCQGNKVNLARGSLGMFSFVVGKILMGVHACYWY
jgi:hypothetical protein